MGSRRVAVTGGTGFVGANLVRRLLRDGHDVCVLCRPSSNRWRIAEVAGAISIVEVDVRDRSGIRHAIDQYRPEWVFHLAATGNSERQSDLFEISQVVFDGTANLLDACSRSGCACFVNAGSSAEYGFKSHPPAETDRLEPNSCYAVCKAAATMLASYSATRTTMRVSTLRLYSVYGPWEDPSRLIPTVIVRGLAGAFPPLVAPDTARDFVYVDDVVDAFVAAASSAKSPSVYNVGTGVQTTLQQVVDLARRVLPIDAQPQWNSMAARIWDTSTWIADPSLIAADLGWRPHYTFAQGFSRSIEWFTSRSDILELYRGQTAVADLKR